MRIGIRFKDFTPEQKREYMKQWHIKNKLRRNKKAKENYLCNINTIKIKHKKYYQSHKIEHLKRQRKNAALRRMNPNTRITNALRCGLYNALKGKKIKRTFDLLGCDINNFKAYLQSKFKDGMSWRNYGSIWHIDHILPVSKFDLTQEAQQRICFHHTNMQPLFALENMRKRARVLYSKQLPLL